MLGSKGVIIEPDKIRVKVSVAVKQVHNAGVARWGSLGQTDELSVPSHVDEHDLYLVLVAQHSVYTIASIIRLSTHRSLSLP